MLKVTLAFQLVALLLVAQQTEAWWWFSEPPAAKAVATFDMDGVQGTITCSQANPQAPTQCSYDLHNLKGNNKYYHVHVKPVPAHDPNLVRDNVTAIAQLCGGPNTGGHHNPHGIKQMLPPKSAPLDQYEVGDLSGKHGPFLKVDGPDDHYVGSFTDDKLPMFGDNSIMSRSIVIHKSNPTKDRWVCASLVQV